LGCVEVLLDLSSRRKDEELPRVTLRLNSNSSNV
jgi:hypothetical protein